MSAEELPDRWIDEEGDEIVNFWHLLNDAGECLGTTDAPAISIGEKSDNSYNYMGHSADDCHSAFEINYSFTEGKNETIAFVEFHCGGDVRGNYTETYIFQFDDADEFYSAVVPCPHYDEDDKQKMRADATIEKNSIETLSPKEDSDGEIVEPSFKNSGCELCKSGGASVYTCDAICGGSNKVYEFDVCGDCLARFHNGE